MPRCPRPHTFSQRKAKSGPLSLLVLLCLLLACSPVPAEEPAEPLSAFQSQAAVAQGIVAACARSAAGCDAAQLPPAATVEGANGPFHARWTWLRETLERAHDAKTEAKADTDRRHSMQAASAQIRSLLVTAGQPTPLPQQTFVQARHEATRILASSEFQTDGGPGWFQRHIARIEDWLLRLFTGMGRLGHRAPWLAPLIEWGCFALAAAGLLWYVRQTLNRQSLRIHLHEDNALHANSRRDATDWEQLAQQCAAEGDWREGVHCLFWAAIALLEGRRAWKPNATRTPREYVRLLRPGSEAQAALRALATLFERSWYGQAATGEQAFRSAEASLHVLAEAKSGPLAAAVGAN